MLLALLSACNGQGSATVTDGPDPTVPEDPPPAEYIYEEGALDAPTADIADVQAALQEALDLTMTINAAPVQTAYNSAMAGSTAQCPYVYTTPDGEYWYDQCTSSNGTDYDGYVFAYEGINIYDPYSGLFYDYWYAFGGATVNVPQGHTLELAGSAVAVKGSVNQGGVDIFIYQIDVGGTFRWDGPEANGTWLSTGLDPDLIAYINSIPSADAVSMTLLGGFGGFGDGWAIAYDENVIGSELLGLPCEDEVSGTLGIRAPDGTWYDIRFDGSDGTDAFNAAACDGCGQVFYQGEPMGEVCVDFSTMLSMGVAPW